MDEIGGGRGRKGERLTPPRGPGRLPSPPPPPPPPPPSGSSAAALPAQQLSAAAGAGAVLALPASRAPAASPAGPGPLATSRRAGEMDGGEALLVRRSSSSGKARKRPAGREPGGGADRFRALWRDYHDVLEETEAKRRRLASAKRIKLGLLAEVKFLRRRYEFLVKASSQQTQYKLKKQARRIPYPVGTSGASAFADHGAGTEAPSTSKSPDLDLDQDSSDRQNDAQGHQRHPEHDGFDQAGVEEDMMTTDVKLSVCRDRNSPGSDDKRAIPWQDRLALKA